MRRSPDKCSGNDIPRISKSGQEQAVASWINYLNQVRLNQLVDNFQQQDMNLRDAMLSVDEALAGIRKVVTSNRGGLKGMHGFIAEVAETGIGNARSQVLGGSKVYQWVDDNGPFDLIRDGIAIQQKFYAAGGSFGLGAIAEHLKRYPDFVTSGHKYQIPNDHYEVVKKLYFMPSEEAGKSLSRSNGGPTFKDWQRVQDFFKVSSVPFESLEPSHLDYRDVQQGTFAATLSAEKESISAIDRAQREAAYLDSKPSIKQGTQAAMAASFIEGSTSFVHAIIEKRREGRKLNEFTQEDWGDVAESTSFGVLKGGLRGASIYALTNFTATPAAVASSIVTAGLGIADQAFRLRSGEITELEFIENSELLSLDAAVGALSSFVGQTIIPVPVLGAVIGNTVGLVMYKSTSSALSAHEARLIEEFREERWALDARLAAEQKILIEQFEVAMDEYVEVLNNAFSPDLEVAFAGSINLAVQLGVAAEDILDSDEKVAAYFLD